MDRRAQAQTTFWPGHGRWFNVDFIRLCLRKYWYGEWYFTGGGRTVAAGELRGSALIVLMAGFGIVMSIHTHRKMLS